MSVLWKVRESVAEVRSAELRVSLQAHEHSWRVEIRKRAKVGGDPVSQANGECDSHGSAKSAAVLAAEALLAALGYPSLTELQKDE